MEELAKNIMFQAGFAGLLLVAGGLAFKCLMNYIVGKDRAHERDRKDRDDRYIMECKRWREDVGTALANNTKAMTDLCKMIENRDDKENERFHATDKKLDAILHRGRIHA